jgi:hypothetical protein
MAFGSGFDFAEYERLIQSIEHPTPSDFVRDFFGKGK